jgi:hypothetical protein
MKINNMRTLQEKYNAIQEGAFTKEQFLRDARLQLPNLITQYNGYDDTVQILKNRGMISENSYSQAEEQLLAAPIGAKATGGGYGPFEKIKSNTWKNTKANSLQHSQALARHIGGFEDFKIQETVKESRLTKNSLTDYRYKPTNDMDKYPYEQILRGLRVELEGMNIHGTPTPEEYKKALTKVLKNLEKDEIFYTNQLAGRSKKVDLHDKMVDATAKNTVDTFNGMKKVKDLKEDHSKNPNDKYIVKFSKTNNTYQVWEGDHLVTDFATKEKAKAYADRENKKQDLTEKVLKEGIKNLIKKALMEEEDLERAERGAGNPYGTEEEYDFYKDFEQESQEDEIDYDDENFSDPLIDGEDELYEMQGPKTAADYRNELHTFLEDNQIYGYTDIIDDIMTGPDQDEAYRELAEFLDDEGIYGYTRRIEQIYADYPYHEHWMNQPDEDETDTLEEGNSEEETGLLIIGRTQIDNNAIGDVLDELELYGEWNVREGYWILPEDEENYDSLEEILEQEFATRGINARFEGIFPDKDNLFESVSLKDLL